MGRDRNGVSAGGAGAESPRRNEEYAEEKEEEAPLRRSRDRKSGGKSRGSSDPDDRGGRKRGRSHRGKRKSRRRESSDEGSDSEDDKSESSDSASGTEHSDSESHGSDSEGESESEEERRRRKRKEMRRREKEEERERKRRRREKEKKRRKREKEERKRKEKKKKEKKERGERGKTGAVTDSWGKYGIIRETDMWTKRPEFTAWLAEVKKVNLESLPNWEEKQMFKEFMEDHNTATFPSKKYYGLDAYHRRQMEKEMKKGFKKIKNTERTVFNDEEQRRQELLQEREKHKEEQVEALKRSMQSGMAQAMKEQAQLREEMAFQYKIGNSEAAAAIQRRLEPDVTM